MKYVPVVYFTSGILNIKKHCTMENDDSRKVGSHSYILCCIVFYSALKIFLEWTDVIKCI